jgi:hypothetical protein
VVLAVAAAEVKTQEMAVQDNQALIEMVVEVVEAAA